MNHEPSHHELHRLFVAKADETITPEEHERLSALLRDSAEARSQWFAFQDAEEGLRAWSQRRALQREEEAGIGLVTSGRGERRSNWKYAGALAAGLAIGLTTWLVWPPGRPESTGRDGLNTVSSDEATTSSVAVLARGVNMEWDRSAGLPALNAPLSPGLLRLKKGVAEIEFFQGARLCVEGPAEIELISASEAYCHSGRFSAHVPPQARGFRIGTPKGDIVDLGTDFGLDLNEASPELHVFKGEVELYQPQAQMRKLTTGNAADLKQSGPAQALVANASAFSFSGDLDARVNESQRMAFENWQQVSARWNDDKDLLLRLDFQDGAGARSLRNVAAHGENIESASMVGCTWTQGRWPGKHALQFRSLSDRVRLYLPGEHRQITMAAWVQLHGLNVRQSSLCMSQGLGAGYAHWQVLHDGSLCLGVGVTQGGMQWEDYISPVVFTPERFGQWVHLAVVYDTVGAGVRFYLNGELLSRHPMKRPVLLKPGIVELGNWTPSPENRQQPVRNFTGCMDDFSFVARALSDAEVGRLSE